MSSSRSYDRREVVAAVLGIIVIGTSVAGVMVFTANMTSTLPLYTPHTEFNFTHHPSNESVRIDHVAGDSFCANETYIIVRDESTQRTTTRTWVTVDPEYGTGDQRCRKVSVTDSFVLADADFESGDQIMVVWQTTRESVPEDQRRAVLAEYEIESTVKSENSGATTSNQNGGAT